MPRRYNIYRSIVNDFYAVYQFRETQYVYLLNIRILFRGKR